MPSANCAFLSCAKAKRTEGTDYELGTTVDQIAAQADRQRDAHSVARARHRSDRPGRQLRQRLRLRVSEQPVVVVADDAAADRSGSARGVRAAVRRRRTPDERRAELRKNASILDWVMGDMARLQRKLGAADRTKVDRVSRRDSRGRAAHPDAPSSRRRIRRCRISSGRSSVPAAWEEHVKLMFDLQVLALQRRHHPGHHFPAGARSQHPDLSADRRAGTAPSGLASRQRPGEAGEARQDQRVSRVAVRLSARADEGDAGRRRYAARPLDDLLGSGMGNPDVHDHTNLPIVVARGGAGGSRAADTSGTRITPLANLHLTLLDDMGVHLDSFVDSTGRTGEVVEPLSLVRGASMSRTAPLTALLLVLSVLPSRGSGNRRGRSSSRP